MKNRTLIIFAAVVLALAGTTVAFVGSSYAVPGNCELLRGGKMKCYSSDGQNWWTTQFSGWGW